MKRRHSFPFLVRRCGLQAVLALSILATAGFSSSTAASAADTKSTPLACFQEAVPWVPKALLPVGEVAAFEEHPQFVYLAGRLSGVDDSAKKDKGPAPEVRLIFLRPGTLVVDVWPFEAIGKRIDKRPSAVSAVEGSADSTKKAKRAIYVFHAPGKKMPRATEKIRTDGDACEVEVVEDGRTFRLDLPAKWNEPARIAVESSDGKPILPKRRFPAGVMPYGEKGMQAIERWDRAYRRDSRPGWDKGAPSSHLKAAVEGGEIKPSKAVVLGCGTGTNAIYLAQKGFDVTAIDIAPTALNLAEAKAKKAGVNVRWLLADVTAPPADLGPFDFIFDRGCYHGVRRSNPVGYVKTLKQLSRGGTNVLILAGNANEKRQYGPPRVKEEEIRGDFSKAFDIVRLDTIRFDSRNPDSQGALAWSILLRRKP